MKSLGVLAAAVAFLASASHAADNAALIADLHFHADPRLSPDAVLATMDRAGVRWAGNGPKGADPNWRAYLDAAPDRFIAFGGQGAIGTRVQSQGEAAWTLRSPDLDRYLEKALEPGLREGRFRGIGELFVNNEHSHQRDFAPTRYPADSPLMRKLLALAATYKAPLSVHMEADPASIAELERLLDADRNATVIWAHCGFHIEADDVKKLMDRHPNLMCELSHRDDRAHRGPLRTSPITAAGRQLKPEWKSLLEEHSDRFLVGTDVDNFDDYGNIIAYYREVFAQLSPEAAERFARGNAMRLWQLKKGGPA